MSDFSIQISADLINQLVNEPDKQKKKTRKSKTKIPPEPPQPQTKVDQKQLHDDPEKHKGPPLPPPPPPPPPPPAVWPVEPPLMLPVTPPADSAHAELEAITSVLKESESVLGKLQKQEDNMVQEVTARAKDLHDKEFKLPYQKPMPCLSDYDAVRACYKEHTNDILRCAPLTRNYYDCVRRVKQQFDK